MQLTSTFAVVLIAVVLCMCEAQWGRSRSQWGRGQVRTRSWDRRQGGSWNTLPSSLDRRQGRSWNTLPSTFDRRQQNFVGGIGGLRQGGSWCDDQCDAGYYCESSQVDGRLQCHDDLSGDIYPLRNVNRRAPLPLGSLGQGLGSSTWQQAPCCLLARPQRCIPTPGCPSNTINNNYWTFNQGRCQRTSILGRFVQYIGSDPDFGNFYDSKDLCSNTCIGESLSYGGQAGYAEPTNFQGGQAELNNFQGGLAEPSNFGRQIAFPGQRGFDGRVRRN